MKGGRKREKLGTAPLSHVGPRDTGPPRDPADLCSEFLPPLNDSVSTKGPGTFLDEP